MTTLTTGSFTSTGAAFNLAIESGFDEFELVNLTDVGSAAASTPVMRAYTSSLMTAGQAYLNLKTNGAATLQLESMITTQGFTVFDAANPPVFGQKAVTGITAASPAVVHAVAHGFVVGDTVLLTSLNGTMTPMNGQIFTVDAVGDADHFTISFDASGAVGGTPATSGFAQKIIPSTFSPNNVVIGPTAVTASGNSLLLNMNVVPSVEQGASQYSPFQHPYQPGAILRFYVPTGFGLPSTANFIYCKIQQINTQAGYALANQLQLQILPGNLTGAITTAAGLPALTWPAGGAAYRSSYPFVTDVAEITSIFSEAEDNTGIRGVTIGTGVQTTGKVYQWFARKGYSI